MTTFKNFIPLIALVCSIPVFTSCEKADEIIEAISESDVVEIIEANLQNDAGGLVTNLEDIAEQLISAVASGELCDTLYTKTIEEDFQGVRFQSEYNSTLSYEMICNAFDIPQSATFSTSTSTIYNSSRIVSDDDSDFSGNASGLQPSSMTMSIGGGYSRTGTQELNFMEQKNITSTLTFDLATIEMSKQDYEIQSGNGTFSLTGSTPDEPFSFDGAIVFNGGNTATLTINGTDYELDWN